MQTTNQFRVLVVYKNSWDGKAKKLQWYSANDIRQALQIMDREIGKKFTVKVELMATLEVWDKIIQ